MAQNSYNTARSCHILSIGCVWRRGSRDCTLQPSSHDIIYTTYSRYEALATVLQLPYSGKIWPALNLEDWPKQLLQTFHWAKWKGLRAHVALSLGLTMSSGAHTWILSPYWYMHTCTWILLVYTTDYRIAGNFRWCKLLQKTWNGIRIKFHFFFRMRAHTHRHAPLLRPRVRAYVLHNYMQG